MAARIGFISEFDSGKEDWSSYVKRLEIWIRANKIKKEDEVNTFLATVGPQAFELLISLASPNDVSDLSFLELKTLLTDYYKPHRNEIGERYTFSKRNQGKDESVADYILGLKRAALHCNFGSTLEEHLRDRLVAGLRFENIQKKLLTDKGLTWQKACELSIAMERADKDTQTFKPQVEQVNKFHQSRTTKHDHFIQKACYRCNGNHDSEKCFHKNKKCDQCGKIGHLARACKGKQSSHPRSHGNQHKRVGGRKYKNRGKAYQLESADEDSDDEEQLCMIYTLEETNGSEFTAVIMLDGKQQEFVIDTGAKVSVIGESLYKKKFAHIPLQESKITLKGYSGSKIPILGKIQVTAQYQGRTQTLPLVVAQGRKVPLLGRMWFRSLNIHLNEINAIDNQGKKMTDILEDYKTVFEGKGTIQNFKADVRVKPDSVPKFCKARPVPYAVKGEVEKELDRLEKDGIVKKIERSDWASPVVIVPKSDKSIRICGDYKVTINPWLEEMVYPMPTVEDLFSKLSGSKIFSKVDLSSAYQQLELSEDSKKLLVINTHKGLYEYQRLSFGVSTAPAMFQCIMEQILNGIDGIEVLLDDILMGTENEDEHLVLVETVLGRLAQHGIKLKLQKCKFQTRSIEYLGHRIDAEGIHPLEDKITAITKAPNPRNVTELRAFIGMVNYYGKFIPNMSTLLAPLYKLLKGDATWTWKKAQEEAFTQCKALLSGKSVLVHYSTDRQLTLACDASAYGIGCVISHIMEDGSERPVAYASRTLTVSEKNYAQLEKEALAIIFGVKKFHKYIYGRSFILITDHKPLTTIFGPKTGVPTLAAARLQRWALILMAHQYEIRYRKSSEHSNADCLSRLPWESSKLATEEKINQVNYLDNFPLSADKIAEATRKDVILSRVLQYTQSGWPNHVDDLLRPFFIRRLEMSVDQGCLLWGMRVVIPPKYQQDVLSELHAEHSGLVRMKSMARSYLWFPGLDKEIENTARGCEACQMTQSEPPVAPLHPWVYPRRAWERIHIDFGEFRSQKFLVVIDSRTKWIEVVLMSSTTASRTIEEMRELFSAYGLPVEVVSDNGPQFTSEEFKEFLQKNGVKHSLTPPYHPASNGAAERSVQIVKSALKKHLVSSQKKENVTSVKQMLANFLLTYRATPHTVTGESPAELFLGRKLRTRLDLLRPDLDRRVEGMQEKQKQAHDREGSTVRDFQVNEPCLVRNREGKNEKWIQGRVIKRLGSLRYRVQIGESTRVTHVDQMQRYRSSENLVSTPPTRPDITDQQLRELVRLPGQTTQPSQSPVTTSDQTRGPESRQPCSDVVPRRYQARLTKPVKRLDL